MSPGMIRSSVWSLTAALVLSGCFVTAPASHSLVDPAKLKPGEAPSVIAVPVNVEVMIFEVDGIPGPNPHQIAGFPSVYNNTFTQAASVSVLPGPHRLKIACRHQPSTYAIAEYTVRELALNLSPGEEVLLFAPEQEAASRQGLILPRTDRCPIRVKSSLGREAVLPDPRGS